MLPGTSGSTGAGRVSTCVLVHCPPHLGFSHFLIASFFFDIHEESVEVDYKDEDEDEKIRK